MFPLDLHPFIVHFPIALLIVGAGCDAVGIVGRIESALRTGYVLLILGAAGALAAAYTGGVAAETASRIPGIRASLAEHETYGTAAAWASILLLLVRTHFLVKRRFVGATRGVYLLVVFSVAALAAAGGYTGGLLVHRFGAGTQPAIEHLDTDFRME